MTPTFWIAPYLCVAQNSLNRAAALHLAPARVNRQPGRLWQEPVFHADFVHQPLAAVQLSQTLEHISVDLVAKTEIFRLGMVGQQFGLPRQQSIAVRHNDWNRSATTQIKLHPKAFEVADAHRTIAATTAEKCPKTGFLTVPRAHRSVKLSDHWNALANRLRRRISRHFRIAESRCLHDFLKGRPGT